MTKPLLSLGLLGSVFSKSQAGRRGAMEDNPQVPVQKVVSLVTGPKPPSDLAKSLREIADAAERGEVVSFAGAFVQRENFEFVYGASLADCLQLATLLQYCCIQRFKL